MFALEFKGVSFSYPDGGKNALQNIDLKVAEGDYLLVLGPNGGGKSTFLKLIVGLLKPDSGQILRGGDSNLLQLQKIGYLPQHTNINPDFPVTVRDVVLMGRSNQRRKFLFNRQRDYELADQLLHQVDMATFSGRRMGTLSGGERQRVLIARALMMEPELLVLDEPTASIDATSKAGFYELLENIQQKITLIMVSHDLNIIPTGANSVACINQTLHHHHTPKITQDILAMTYGCTSTGDCPVELVAHGVPHRVLAPHPQERKHG